MDNKRFIMFVVVALGIFIGWGYLWDRFSPHTPPKAQVAAQAEAKPGDAALKPAQAAKASAAKSAAKPAQVEARAVVENDLVRVEFTNRGAKVSSWQLKRFKQDQHKDGMVELIPMSPTALAERSAFGVCELPGLALDSSLWRMEPVVEAAGGKQVAFTLDLKDQGLTLRKVWTLPSEGYEARVRLEIANTAAAPRTLSSLALLVGPGLGQPNPGDSYDRNGSAVLTEGSLKRETGGKDKVEDYNERARWVAVKNHYFAAILLPQSQALGHGMARRHADGTVTSVLMADALDVPAHGATAVEASLYAGPQDYDLLKARGVNQHKVIDFGWFSIFAEPMLWLLKKLYLVVRNYGLAIILLTVIVKALLWFPTHKGMTSMRHFQKAQAQIQPRLETLKKVYKDDPRKLNEETLKIYKEMGVNPLAGCLPMLVQIPLFIALYAALNNAFELRGAPFFWFWTDLSARDPFWVLPLLMGVSMWIQQKITPVMNTTPEAAQQQKIMLWMMPIMLTGMAIWFAWPAGLLLYMFVQNLLGIAQQVYINKTVA